MNHRLAPGHLRWLGLPAEMSLSLTIFRLKISILCFWSNFQKRKPDWTRLEPSTTCFDCRSPAVPSWNGRWP